MKKNEKVGFFQKIILAISDFRIYPHILKTESLARSIGHFVLFMLIIVTVISASYTVRVLEGIDTLLASYDEKVPEFTLENGILNVDKKDVVIVQNDLIAIVNTDYEYKECTKLEQYSKYDRYKNKIFINSDAITMENLYGSNSTQFIDEPKVTSLMLSDIALEYNKTSFYEEIVSIKDSINFKITLFVLVFTMLFLANGLSKILELILYAVMISLFSTLSGMKLSFKNYVKMSIYIVTLPYILETISFVYIGQTTETTFLISSLLAYVYIFYAVRAVKLDAFLIIINKSGKIEKSKNGGTLISIENEKENSSTNESEDVKEDSKDEDNSQK